MKSAATPGNRDLTDHQERDSQGPDDQWLGEVIVCLEAGKAVRREFAGDGRLHIDRPLPFLCVHIAEAKHAVVAREITQSNASYLIAPDAKAAAPVIETVGRVLRQRLGAFFVLEYGEFEHDDAPAKDAPYLPPFTIEVTAGEDPAAQAAAKAFLGSVSTIEGKFRTAHMDLLAPQPTADADVPPLTLFPHINVRFAPIYREPGTRRIYPELRERLIANIFDAGLKALAAATQSATDTSVSTHRAFGRKTFVETVARTDRAIDEIASSFDFLLAVTPINADAASAEFSSSRYEVGPRLLYRPLTLEVEAAKKKLFSISFEHLEDPLLYALYRQKQQELDLQLSMISAREGRTFVEFGRALYGPVEAKLLDVATDILRQTQKRVGEPGRKPAVDEVDCAYVRNRAQTMVSAYKRQYADFTASVEVRDDIPAGLLVSRSQLLIARSTTMSRHRVEALLNHEIGVHLLTYFNGSAQGLRLFRSGLAGYEGMQEGLAVFAEYLSGGMTLARLRLIAARVVACAAMLNGALFPETYRLLVDQHRFQPNDAFNIVLRIYRGGGLAKDAIYLRGLLQLLAHLGAGGSLEPFWMGKIAASHFAAMQELSLRGLLGAPAVRPIFLDDAHARARLDRARGGITPLDMVAE
ncbi:flavohemoglobin expression-modulating QEGLA motif protein [Ensifer sp. 4252]|uniref:flavohemoglobin expression-modulating QEGLA motif protein n=1 Tax=Ensifer sp. 4252 TaxID=3373915 RepID=UPI003D21F0D0